MAELLGELCRLSDEDRLAAGCQAAYRRTLAAHHPWLAQKAALLAMFALGTRGETLLKVGGGLISRGVSRRRREAAKGWVFIWDSDTTEGWTRER